MEKGVQFCERKIRMKAIDVLKLDDFFDCDQQLFQNVLQLISSKCRASIIIDACMNWAKAECQHENLDFSSENLRAQPSRTV